MNQVEDHYFPCCSSCLLVDLRITHAFEKKLITEGSAIIKHEYFLNSFIRNRLKSGLEVSYMSVPFQKKNQPDVSLKRGFYFAGSRCHLSIFVGKILANTYFLFNWELQLISLRADSIDSLKRSKVPPQIESLEGPLWKLKSH